MTTQNKYFEPECKRFQFNVCCAYRKQSLSNISEKNFSFGKKLKIYGESFVSSIINKVSYEHFDYVIMGYDYLLSLIAAYELAKSGERVFINPENFSQDDETIEKLNKFYISLYNQKLLSFLKEKYSFLKNCNYLLDCVVEFISIIQKINYANFYPLVLISDNTTYALCSQWNNRMNGHPQLINMEMNKDLNCEIWGKIEKSLTKLKEKKIIENKSYTSNKSVMTFENLILTSESTFVDTLSLEPNNTFIANLILEPLHLRNECSVDNRIEDIFKILKWFKEKNINNKNWLIRR